MRVKSNLLNDLKLIWVVQSPAKKYSCFHLTRLKSISMGSRPTQEGRLAIVTNAGRDAVDAAVSGTQVLTNDAISGEAGLPRTAKTCGPSTPTLVSSSQAIADDGGKKARSPGRARYKP